MRRIKRLGIVAVAAMLATGLTVVNADPAAAAPSRAGVTTHESLQEEAEAFVDAAIKLEPSIVRAEDGTLSVRTSAVRAGVGQEAFTQVVESIRVVNRAVRSGELTTTPDLQVLPTGFTTMHNGIRNHWWGLEVHLTAGGANKVAAALAAGVGIAALIGILTAVIGGGVPATIAAALLTIGAAALAFCNANGTGVKIFRPHIGPPWCTAH